MRRVLEIRQAIRAVFRGLCLYVVGGLRLTTCVLVHKYGFSIA